MVIITLLKRRDGASVVVAVVVGLILASLLSSVAEPLASEISLRNPETTGDAGTLYLYPVVFAALQLLALEVLSWLYVGLNAFTKSK